MSSSTASHALTPKITRLRHTSGSASSLCGHILLASGDEYEVSCTEGRLRARRASSCLLEPAVGDLVHVLIPRHAEFVYVVALLERGNPDRSRGSPEPPR